MNNPVKNKLKSEILKPFFDVNVKCNHQIINVLIG